jgi:hypothetical protein
MIFGRMRNRVMFADLHFAVENRCRYAYFFAMRVRYFILFVLSSVLPSCVTPQNRRMIDPDVDKGRKIATVVGRFLLPCPREIA